jgi:hypothetical protein
MPTTLPFSLEARDSFEAFQTRFGPRRFRLYLSGMLRGLFPAPLHPTVADAFERCDRFADTGKSKSALREAKALIHYAPRPVRTERQAHLSFRNIIGHRHAEPFELLRQLLGEDPDASLIWLMHHGVRYSLDAKIPEADEYLLRVLNEMMGPDQPPRFLPEWRTSDVVGLARGIYRDLAFDRMPILADALVDAGCDADAVVEHCRGSGSHVRGCWVLDAILDGQWESAWQEPKAARAPKGPRSPFKLDRVGKAEFERLVQGEAKATLEDAITEKYQHCLTFREEAARNSRASFPNWSLDQRREYVTYDNLTPIIDPWLVHGVVRRITNSDPAELARYGAITSRIEWVRNGQGRGPQAFWRLPLAMLTALAVRDDLALQRLVETCPKSGSEHGHLFYLTLVRAAVHGDWEYVRKQALEIESRTELREQYLANALCIVAIADATAELVAARLQAAVVAHRRWSGHRVLKHVALEAHGLYELARRKSADLVATFDVNHPAPWDAEYHAWLQANTRTLPDIDWEKFPTEIRTGLRDLPRPAWWDVLPEN